MQKESRQNFYPFSQTPGDKLGNGLHSDVFSLGNEWVVKRIKPLWRRGNWQQRLVNDFKLLEHHLGPFIPTTGVVICSENSITPPTLLIVQKRVQGNTLKQLSWQEITANTTTVEQLEDLGSRIQKMYEQTRMTPDLHGDIKNILRYFDFKHSNNLFITQEGQVLWTDIERLGPLWSPNWIGGKIHMALMIKSFDTFLNKLHRSHKL